jgi:hypothetical protein
LAKRVAAWLGAVTVTTRIGSITLELQADKSKAHKSAALGLKAIDWTDNKKLTCMIKIFDKNRTYEILG